MIQVALNSQILTKLQLISFVKERIFDWDPLLKKRVKKSLILIDGLHVYSCSHFKKDELLEAARIPQASYSQLHGDRAGEVHIGNGDKRGEEAVH